MEVEVPHHEWRVLRLVKRTKKPSLGRTLRVKMSRATKDGSFLTNLVKLGLMKIESHATDPFEATYSLTELGKEAAEYGVYDVDLDVFRALQRMKKGE
jgi:hypothetical protein